MAILKEHRKQAIEHHGLESHPLYQRWRAMMNRCYNPKYEGYHRYGGRGIRVCDEWKEHPAIFIEWALSNGWKPELEIDRMDTQGNYEPNNCRYTTHSVNQRNKRRPKTKRKQSALPIGVVKTSNKFGARYWLNGKCIWVGSLNTAQEAGEAYQNAVAA